MSARPHSAGSHAGRENSALSGAAGRPALWAIWVIWGGAALLLLARVAHLWDLDLVVDDAYISFRYAANLVAGHGLVFNPGERVEGYTNFLWTVLLAGGLRLGIDPVRLSVALALLAALAILWLLARLAVHLLVRRGEVWTWLPAALPPLLYAGMGSQPRYVLSGMETLLFAFLVLAGADLALCRARLLAAGAVFALAAMTRPEGGVYWLLAVGAAVAGWRIAARLHAAAPLVLAFVVLYLPYFLARWAFYRHLLPNTFYAKAGSFSAERAARGWEQLVQLIAGWSAVPLLLLALVALVSAIATRGLLRGPHRRTWLFCVAAVAFTAAYFVAVGGDFLAFFGPRFLMPALPFLLLLAALGLCRLLAALRRAGVPRRAVTAAAAAALAALLANGVWLTWPARLDRLEGLALEMESWSRLGLWLRHHTPPGAVIATGGAGIVPYFSGRPTLDMYGLTDEHIAHLPPLRRGYRAAAHEKFAPHYVLDRRPDLVITGLTREGRPRTAGLPRAARRLAVCYEPWLLGKVRGGPPADGRWVLEVDAFTPELFDAGYQNAVLRRRTGRRAEARCERVTARTRPRPAGPRPGSENG